MEFHRSCDGTLENLNVIPRCLTSVKSAGRTSWDSRFFPWSVYRNLVLKYATNIAIGGLEIWKFNQPTAGVQERHQSKANPSRTASSDGLSIEDHQIPNFRPLYHRTSCTSKIRSASEYRSRDRPNRLRDLAVEGKDRRRNRGLKVR